MSFPRYSKYKDSGIEWLGEVPIDWKIRRLKHTLFSKITDGPHTTPLFIEDGIPFLSVDGIQNGELQFDNCRYISEKDHIEFSKKASPKRDDLLMGKAASTGKIARVKVDFEFSIWSPLALIRIDGRIANPIFVEYFLKSPISQAQIETYCTANTQKNISMDDIPKLTLTFPSLEEQTIIASFLDQETAKIDDLIAEQQRLIELLKEKRQAVISHAVTKGLNPDAPMKPSGIEWLGDVPGHWEVLKGSAIGSLFGSEQIVEEYISEEGHIPFIKVGSMSTDSFEIQSWDWFVNRDIASRFRIRSNYVVFPKRGAAIFMNKVNIVECPSFIDPNLMGWEVSKIAIPKFIAFALKCRKLDELADVSTVPQINNKHIAPERFPIPPLEEQKAIITFLDGETTKLDTLTTEAQRAIALLQERRTALISAAVTGKMDVRGFVEQRKAA